MVAKLDRSAHRKARGWARPVQLVVALTCAALAVGCGSSSSSSSSAPSSPATSASPAAPAVTTTSAAASSSATTAGPAACPTSGLKVTQTAPNGYAGGVYVTIDFTNTSGTTCTLYGYPGVSLVSAAPYKQIGPAAKRVSTVPVKLITLAPGATANASLQIVDALNFPTASCSPTQAANLRIYPPNQTAPVYLPNTSQACTKQVQTLYISAVQAGSGSAS